MLDQAGVITVEEALTADGESAARLDVLTRDIARPITSGFTATGCAKSCFTTDDHDDSNLQERDGELYVTPGDAAVEVGSWDELQAAFDNPPASGSIGLKNDVTADDDEPEATDESGEIIETEETTAETTEETEETAETTETVPAGTSPNGAEDGLISGADPDKLILTDSIDDLPLSEIETYIKPDDQYYNDTRLMVHMCNTCYKFFKDYLNWLV